MMGRYSDLIGCMINLGIGILTKKLNYYLKEFLELKNAEHIALNIIKNLMSLLNTKFTQYLNIDQRRANRSIIIRASQC